LAEAPSSNAIDSESAWQRARRDFGPAFLGLRGVIWSVFWAAAGIGATIYLSPHHSLLAQVAIGVGLFLGGVVWAGVSVLGALWVVAPVCQRDEARTQLTGIQAARDLMPDIEVAIPYAWYLDEETDGNRYLMFPVTVVNRESSRRIILEFEFVLEHVYNSPGITGRNLEVTLSPSHEGRRGTLPKRLVVEAETAEEGTFLSRWYLSSGLEFEEAMQTVSPSREQDRLFVKVTEIISRKTFEVPVPGTWPTVEDPA
jgi:hypothetical protein